MSHACPHHAHVQRQAEQRKLAAIPGMLNPNAIDDPIADSS